MANLFLESDEELEDVFEFEPEEAAALTASAGPDPRVELAKRILRQLHESLGHVVSLLEGASSPNELGPVLAQLVTGKKTVERQLEDISGARVMEGVFDGQCMIGSDGKSYAVPPNYASKSRLVEGDILKLTIKKDGSFLYKQIGPIERKRVIGTIAYDASAGSHVVLCGETTYQILTASVTFFRGAPGDEAVILVPKTTPSVWAAIENVVKK